MQDSVGQQDWWFDENHWARVFREKETLILSFAYKQSFWGYLQAEKNLLKFNSLIAYQPVKICMWSEPSVGGSDIQLISIIAAREETWDLNVQSPFSKSCGEFRSSCPFESTFSSVNGGAYFNVANHRHQSSPRRLWENQLVVAELGGNAVENSCQDDTVVKRGILANSDHSKKSPSILKACD